ncbi:MAG: DUF4062 domain-containing protein [Phycisphaeraceae bacterium]
MSIEISGSCDGYGDASLSQDSAHVGGGGRRLDRSAQLTAFHQPRLTLAFLRPTMLRLSTFPCGLPMSGHDRHVRVFISSTFRDMHAERDHLVTVVFPELRDRLARLGLSLYDVDLRWGVPSKTVDGETANSWAYCRKWIEKVQPFFVGILGQRYGYVPTEEKLKEGEKDKDKKPAYLGKSITEMEIRYGYLDTKLRPKSYFYLRRTPLPASAPPEARERYVDVEYVTELDKLKNDILACGRPAHYYDCRWTGNDFTDLEDFGTMVLDDLWSAILRDPNHVTPELWRQVLGCDPNEKPWYTDDAQPVPQELWEQLLAKIAPPEKDDSLPAQAEQMARFAGDRLRWFQGRTQELADLQAFIDGDASTQDLPRICVVQAVAGQGKSALLSKLCQLLANAGHRLVGIASTLDQTAQPQQPTS